MLRTIKFGKTNKNRKEIMNTENNKIIAEFMQDKEEIILHLNDELKSLSAPLKCYHSDWTWLMEAVLKCKENQIFGSQNLVDDIDNALISTQIQAVYNACVAFIKWYNEQNK